MLVVYAGILAFGLNEFRKTPVGFIPQVDRGYLIVVTQLPPGASLARTDEVNRRAVEIALKVPGVAHAVNIVGFSGATFTNAPNSGAIFVVLEPFERARARPAEVGAGDPGRAVQAAVRDPGGLVLVVAPPPVHGIGNAGGFRMMIEDRAGRGPQALQAAVGAMMGARRRRPASRRCSRCSRPRRRSSISTSTAPRRRCSASTSPMCFGALQIYLGSSYVNDFNLLGAPSA